MQCDASKQHVRRRNRVKRRFLIRRPLETAAVRRSVHSTCAQREAVKTGNQAEISVVEQSSGSERRTHPDTNCLASLEHCKSTASREAAKKSTISPEFDGELVRERAVGGEEFANPRIRSTCVNHKRVSVKNEIESQV